MLEVTAWINNRDKSDVVWHAVKKLTLTVRGAKGKTIRVVLTELAGHANVAQHQVES